MLRITRTDDDAGRTLLKLEGKLLAAWTAELTAQAPRSAGRLELDLSAVTFVDDAGRAVLLDLISRGATLSGCSGYLSELLHVEKP
jgi:ABC-type transporter Mla MlaB component